jgi:hypothetical protein
MRRRHLVALLAVLGLAATPLLAPAEAGLSPVARLRPGGQAFWGPGASHQLDQSGETVMQLVVASGGKRLRVAFDHPDYRAGFSFALYRPDGSLAEVAGGYNAGEVYVDHPPAGTWTLRFNGDAAEREVRFRARLENRAAPRTKGPLLPNLQLVPPYEFTFDGALNVMRSPIAQSPDSCTPDDTAEHLGVRCLRFSIGPANVGRGPLELVFPGGGQGLVTEGKAYQRIYHGDGHTIMRGAGTFLYHKTHAHYHHTGFGRLELFRVTDAKRGRMTLAGTGPKQGFCTGDVMIANWSSFANAEQNSANSPCLGQMGPTGTVGPAGTGMGLSPGWADLYSWEQDGNYVDFGLNQDGDYLVRSTADAAGVILESNEKDNTSYAFIRIRGTAITVLERGRGLGPWDKHKALAHDGLHLTAS